MHPWSSKAKQQNKSKCHRSALCARSEVRAHPSTAWQPLTLDSRTDPLSASRKWTVPPITWGVSFSRWQWQFSSLLWQVLQHLIAFRQTNWKSGFLTALPSVSYRAKLTTPCLFANRFCFKQLEESKTFSEAVRAAGLSADLMELGYDSAETQNVAVYCVKEIKSFQGVWLSNLWKKIIWVTSTDQSLSNPK